MGKTMMEKMQPKLCNTHEWCEGDCSAPHLTFNADVASQTRFMAYFEPDSSNIEVETVSWKAASPPSGMFQYQPLTSSSSMIRFLRVETAELRSAPLVCSLVEFDLDSTPKFSALSYYWGPPKFDKQVLWTEKSSP